MFHELRAHYMSRFEKALAESRREFTQAAAEVMLDVPRPEEPELLYRIWRMDIMGQTPDGPKAIEVNVENLIPAASSLDGFGMPITLCPAAWNGLEFVVDGEPPVQAAMLTWIAKWVDIDDERYVAGANFQWVIHNCLRPTVTAAGYWTSVDFGSAPVEAVHEFISILAPGARSIRMGSGFQSGAA
jgi:hypothetical protein